MINNWVSNENCLICIKQQIWSRRASLSKMMTLTSSFLLSIRWRAGTYLDLIGVGISDKYNRLCQTSFRSASSWACVVDPRQRLHRAGPVLASRTSGHWVAADRPQGCCASAGGHDPREECLTRNVVTSSFDHRPGDWTQMGWRCRKEYHCRDWDKGMRLFITLVSIDWEINYCFNTYSTFIACKEGRDRRIDGAIG